MWWARIHHYVRHSPHLDGDRGHPYLHRGQIYNINQNSIDTSYHHRWRVPCVFTRRKWPVHHLQTCKLRQYASWKPWSVRFWYMGSINRRWLTQVLSGSKLHWCVYRSQREWPLQKSNTRSAMRRHGWKLDHSSSRSVDWKEVCGWIMGLRCRHMFKTLEHNWCSLRRSSSGRSSVESNFNPNQDFDTVLFTKHISEQWLHTTLHFLSLRPGTLIEVISSWDIQSLKNERRFWEQLSLQSHSLQAQHSQPSYIWHRLQSRNNKD